MIETVSKKVSTTQEQYTINLMTRFGWTLKSSQEINNTDSHLERHGDTIYNVTKKENYVKLVFDRNTEMKNYRRIVELEREYNALLNTRPQLHILKILGSVVLLFVFFPIGIYLGYKTFKEIKEQSQDWGAQLKIKGAPILNEVSTLL